MFGWLRNNPTPRPYTVGEYLDNVSEAVDASVRKYPSSGWLESYNRRMAEEDAAKMSDAQVQSVLFPNTELVFPDGQPSVFYESEGGVPYRGQENAKELLDINIGAMQPGERFKCLITGPAGVGKTTLAWIIARRIQERQDRMGVARGRFYEVLPNQIDSKSVLDSLMHSLRENDIVFIDEIHVLKEMLGVEVLYNVLADGGTARYPLSNGEGWVTLPDGVCWITATTEPGALDRTNGGALNRRLQPEIELQEPTLEDLVHILQDQTTPIHPEAAYEIAERSGFLPWQGLLVYGQARSVALYEECDQVHPPHAHKAFEIMGLDHLGLLPRDRKVLKVLMGVKHTQANGKVVHRMSEAAVTAAAGLDRATYRDRVQPKLQRMGLLTTVGGQTLTDKALREYGHLAST